MKIILLLIIFVLVLPSVIYGQDDAPAYTLDIVGGEDVTLEIDGATIDGITVGTTSVRSTYPNGGMIFAAGITSENGAVTDVKATANVPGGTTERVDAALDDETGQWVAELFPAGNNMLPWRNFDFQWRVSDESGEQIFTEPVPLNYWDPTREWYRLENDYMIMYWFGVEEIDPEYIAETTTEVMQITEEMRRQAFGFELDYKPVAIVYGTRVATAETIGTPMLMSGLAGLTPGMTLQTFGARDDAWFERQADCIHVTPREEQTQQYLVDRAIHGTIPHEITHLYQAEMGVGGPNWWSEGQATYFTVEQGIYDVGANERIRQLAQYQDLNSLDGNSLGTLTFEQDGCYAVGYDAGTSFIDFLVRNYGGLDNHWAFLESMGSGMTFGEALEAVTGKTFLELENEWRAIYGYRPLTPEDLDPALRLTDAIAPVYVEGDTFDVPGPLPVPLNQDPGPGALPTGTGCLAGTEVTVLRVGSIEGVNYYEVDCLGITGWLPEEKIP